jgi:hypothetical protein
MPPILKGRPFELGLETRSYFPCWYDSYGILGAIINFKAQNYENLEKNTLFIK